MYIATIPFDHAPLNSKDILGHVYEYMLGQFVLDEGKKGGQFYIMPTFLWQHKLLLRFSFLNCFLNLGNIRVQLFQYIR
ncbi:hypothetical protein CAY62_20750 (plasmid) [Photobacterium damselae subsp. damselae]|nr:hypothetical protein CAY62_20750 [Photobacterium damselae subsp. damselae]